MHTKAVYQAAKALARIGVAALRFNFRGVGRSAGTFDGGPGEMDDFRGRARLRGERIPDCRCGRRAFSFGSWIALTVGARGPARAAAARHRAAGRSLRLRVREERDKPKFLIHGEQDELISIKDVRKFYAELREPKELVVIEDADHLFEGKTRDVGEAVEESR